MAILSDHESESAPKRRKIRKGTQSCWECKRRKVRCSGEQVCQNCQRRGTPCVSQDLPDEPGSVTNRIQNADNSVLTPIPEDNTANATVSPPRRSVYATPSSKNTEINDLECALRSAWPSQNEIDLIIHMPIGLSVFFHNGVCTLYNNPTSHGQASSEDILPLPPSGSHPVLVARSLLLLGNYLQGIVLPDGQSSPRPGSKYHIIMCRAVDTAVKLVTKNEDLTNSVEGIECIMLEAAYQNYAGNLHQAWMAVRRATTMSQLLGLHRGVSSSSLKFLEPQTRTYFNAEMICFRLVQMDCYLGLVLGLQRSSLQAHGNLQDLDSFQPVDRIDRIHCLVADRILRRKGNDMSETQELDMLLEEAAAGMPSQWWLMPDLSPGGCTESELARDTNRLMTQLSQYHLLIRLHLPYLMRSSSSAYGDYSKMTVVNASRETLSRYLAFRVNNPAHFYCRGTDFLCFIAATVLCFAHIECFRSRQTQNPSHNGHNAFGLLVHARPSDIGLVEKITEIIKSISQDLEDAIASQILRVLDQLLDIVAKVARGVSYGVEAGGTGDGSLAYHGEATDGGEGLQLHIPHFGTIKFLRHGIKRAVPATTISRETTLAQGDIFDFQSGDVPITTALSGFDGEWDMQGIDLALFEGLFGESSMLDATGTLSWM